MVLDGNTPALLIPLCFLLIGLTITVALNPYISRKQRIIMFTIIGLSLTLIAQNIIEDALASGELNWFWRTTASVYGYSVRPVFLILFLYIVCPDEKHLGCWVLAIANFLINITAYFSRICFWIDEGNHYQGGPLSKACLIISLIMIACWFYKSVRKSSDHSGAGRRGMLIHIFVVLMLLASVFLDVTLDEAGQPITFLTFAIVISSVFYYIWLHLRFVQMHEDDL